MAKILLREIRLASKTRAGWIKGESFIRKASQGKKEGLARVFPKAISIQISASAGQAGLVSRPAHSQRRSHPTPFNEEAPIPKPGFALQEEYGASQTGHGLCGQSARERIQNQWEQVIAMAHFF